MAVAEVFGAVHLGLVCALFAGSGILARYVGQGWSFTLWLGLMVFIHPVILRDGVHTAIESNARYNAVRDEIL